METLLGRVIRVGSVDGDGTFGVATDKAIAQWYAKDDPNYAFHTYTTYYMSPVGMPRKYGFWAPPDLWARVLIGQPDNADPNYWVYLGSVFEAEGGMATEHQYFLDNYEKNIRMGVAPIQESYKSSIQSQAYGLINKERAGLIISESLGKNSDKQINNDNKGVFLNTKNGKSIRLQDSQPSNSIEIQNESGGDGISITGVSKTERTLGSRSIDITTLGNTRLQSRGAELEICVGKGGFNTNGHGTKLRISNKSFSWGGQSKTSMKADVMEDLTAEGCGSIIIKSDWNDVEVFAMHGRIMLAASGDIQIKALGSAKVYATSDVYVESGGSITLNAQNDINIQSKTGDINLKAVLGGVNIEAGADNIDLQSGGGGQIQLNKFPPGSVTVSEIPATEASKYNQQLLKERIDNGDITPE